MRGKKEINKRKRRRIRFARRITMKIKTEKQGYIKKEKQLEINAEGKKNKARRKY